MALVSEGQEYASPSKRIKLDQTQHLSTYSVDLEIGRLSEEPRDIGDVLDGDPDLTGFALSDNVPDNKTSVVFSNSDDSKLKDNDTRNQTEHNVEDDKDDVASTVSHLSDLSGLSDLSTQECKQVSGAMTWVQKQMSAGVNPRNLLNQIIGKGSTIPEQMDDFTLWKIIANFLSEPPRRERLRHVNTLTDVVRLLRGATKVVVLTGAGVSVSCGIPDFRSRDGIYSRLAVDFPDLPDPQAMFDIQYFSQDPRPFFKFAREIYPGQFKPSPCHRFIKMLEKQKKLLRNYTQNIDTLEQVAGIKNVIECHGSFATASCTRCGYKVAADSIREEIFAQKIPLCSKCTSGLLPSLIDSENNDSYKKLFSQGVMKPDIVFFGEGLPDVFHESMANDKDECDLLIVIGSSLKVRPVALIPSSINPEVPQILINREPLPNFNFDVQLLGDCDVIISQICYLLGGDWLEMCSTPSPLNEAKHLCLPNDSWRNNCDDSWEERSSDPCATDCSRDSLNARAVNPLQGDNSSQDGCIALATSSVGSLSVQNGAALRDGQDHCHEARSLRMSIDSGLGMSTGGNSICAVNKERHMSVDSSTRDSGVCFLLDSPTDNVDHLNVQTIDHQSEASSSSSNNSKVCPELLVNCQKACLLTGNMSSNVDPNIVSLDSSELCHRNSELSINTSTAVCNVEPNKINRRHMSIDSLKDSGIGDTSSTVTVQDRHMSVDSNEDQQKCEDNIEMLRACWQPKIKESLASRLPENSYYFIHPNRYIFPGAEVFYDPDEAHHSAYSSSGSSSSSDSGSSSSEDSDNEDVDADYWVELGVSADKPTHGRCP